MPEENNFLEYHKSIARELDATKDRIRQLIGSRHWQTDGEHKETVLRKVLRDHLPESVSVRRGFVCFRNETSNQIDILITANDKPTLFKDGELVLVTPDAVKAIVEVKTSLNSRSDIQAAITKLSNNIESIRSNSNIGCLAGLFVYEDSENQNIIEDRIILEELQSAANDQQNRVINWIAFGPNRFFRYWERGYDVSSLCSGNVWHSYELADGLAHAYFLSNVVWDISKERGIIDHHMQYAWFPVEGGKEQFRRWCISRSNGPAAKFSQDWNP